MRAPIFALSALFVTGAVCACQSAPPVDEDIPAVAGGGTSGGSSGAPKVGNSPLPGDLALCPYGQCTEAALAGYTSCVAKQCVAELKAYETSCRARVTCLDKCACGTDTCAAACPTANMDCDAAKLAALQCGFNKCRTDVKCGGTTKSCVQLAACCMRIADSTKASCDKLAAGGNDVPCSNAYALYESACP
jgi:hypothetical protein